MENAKIKKVSLSHRKVYTDIIIDAPAEATWAVLTDTASYKDWATFMVDVQGEIKDGGKITAIFQQDPKKEKFMNIDHTISVTDGQEFYWSEKFTGGILDNHHFIVEAINDKQSKFIQTDEFRGGMTWLLGGMVTKACCAGYQAFNKAIKQEVERRQN